MRHSIGDKERQWRTGEMVAAIKARGGVTAELFANDLDEIERRLLLGLLDPLDESAIEVAYWQAFSKAFEV